MVFALEHLQEMERRYPGVLSMMKKNPGKWKEYYSKNTIPLGHLDGLTALKEWTNYKIVYNFSEDISTELLASEIERDTELPVSAMRHLPYPCIAVHTLPFEFNDKKKQQVIRSYTGDVYLYARKNRLFASWCLSGFSDAPDNNYCFEPSYIDLIEGYSLADCFEKTARDSILAYFTREDYWKILDVLGVNRFSDGRFTEESYKLLSAKFGETNAARIIRLVEQSFYQGALMQRAIQIILYLNCTNADIESAQEKLKAGAWSSLIGGEETSTVPRTIRRQALRENEGTQVMDVGYRIAGKFRRGLSGNRVSSPGEETGTRGYSKRRAHFHHYWIGPRNGKLSDDIMNPKPGERGLILKWIEATEIHPELKDDLTVMVPVE